MAAGKDKVRFDDGREDVEKLDLLVMIARGEDQPLLELLRKFGSVLLSFCERLTSFQ
jgi:hypothetical protein